MNNEPIESNYPRKEAGGSASGLSAYVAIGAVLLLIFVPVFFVIGLLMVIDPRSSLLRGTLDNRMLLSGILQLGMGIVASGWMGAALRMTCERQGVPLAVPRVLVVLGVFFSPVLLFLPAFLAFDFLLRRHGLPRGLAAAFVVLGVSGIAVSILTLATNPGNAVLLLISGSATQAALVLGWVMGRRVTRALQSSG